ncbi:hypothetical protein [Deinococcus sp. KNUC1210]|uniref:hypothetical protein n=1 Tax=Deinococcus sp. KNUC1210 TaxID=2917691 RepID=UPI00351DA6A3
MSLLNFDSLPAGLEQQVGHYTAQLWAESYELHTAQALFQYQGGPLHGQAAVTRLGTVTVIGAHSEALIAHVLEELLTQVHLPVTRLPEGVRLSRRGSGTDTITLIQNWNAHSLRWQDLELAPFSSRVLRETEVLA